MSAALNGSHVDGLLGSFGRGFVIVAIALGAVALGVALRNAWKDRRL